jgi:AcrR family transcriptional regulator
MNMPDLGHEKEHLILDAAQNRFARFGFSKVTMDEIAEDVGMAKASLYYYYPSKEDVFRAVLRREQEQFLFFEIIRLAGGHITCFARQKKVSGCDSAVRIDEIAA